MLKIEDLTVKAGDKVIIDGLNLEIEENTIHVIMGQNGAGKSTILKAIMNIDDYDIVKGKITYNGEDITGLDTSLIAKKGIYYLMQNPTEVMGITNAEIIRTARSERGIKESIFEFNKRVDEASSALSIDKSFIYRDANVSMSGGEKKKNELLQMYLLSPKLILLDEMDSGLDVDGLDTLTKALVEYKNKNNASILIITHHTNILKNIMPNKVHVLLDGKISEVGDISLAEKIEKNGFKGAFNRDLEAENE